jgi:DNA-binding HxlR family transcriptional regulator
MDIQTERCAITTTLQVLGGKWKIVILWHLIEKTRRFNEIKHLIKGITHKMLAQQLRELEANGLIRREVYPEVPPHVEYSITAYGSTLIPVLKAMAQWGLEHEQGFIEQVVNNGARGM